LPRKKGIIVAIVAKDEKAGPHGWRRIAAWFRQPFQVLRTSPACSETIVAAAGYALP
jgi:hypothetical protein